MQEPIHFQLYHEEKKQIVENRKKLVPIIETVLFCGRQGLALRGHRDGGRVVLDNADGEANEGNFRELLKYRAKYDDHLQHVLSHSKNNALYTSWNIQNEIIEISNDLILENLVKNINSSMYFSVLVDETTDISCIEQMTLCVRCIDSTFSIIEELFLQFVPLENVTGKGISMAIMKKLKDVGIDLNKMRGQGYDGAAAMSGNFNGVQAHIQAIYPKALYVHCAAHSLNLAVSNSCDLPLVRNCLGTIGKLYDFFHTPKRQAVIKQCLAESDVVSRHEKLIRLCATRWTERYNSVAVFVELYDSVALALETISKWTNKDSANAANQLVASIKKPEFVISLQVVNQVFNFSSILCKALQQRNIDLKRAVNLAEDTIAELQKLRDNANMEFKKLFLNVKKLGEKFEFPINKPRTSLHQTKRCNIDTESAEDYYRIAIYIRFLDSFIINLKERFLKHKEILAGFQSLFPKDPSILTDETLSEFQSLVLFYEEDLTGTKDELVVELKLWYRTIARLPNEERPRDALSALQHVTDTFTNIKILLHILAILPVSTAEGERSFSTLRRLKTYLRNSSSENRLNGLTLLNIYRNMTPSVDNILDKFIEKPRKLKLSLA